MFGKKNKAEAAKAEQEASKKTDGRILLYSDIIDALYDEMPRESGRPCWKLSSSWNIRSTWAR
ncbi:hypothetical protein ACXO2Y_03250 [Lactobacillus delbrueckii subsp. bulgaricus]|uniref:hypothetical protein n=1 Tax=Lactobacillus delbrueckii TaxID=1584 RepID=UPI0012E21C58|nr:hypothetical protein [Lactobacillus delbrueckii]MBT8849237.1 hypothetical protein [Lactobacillus delbrueckii subsp. bulgaricus]MBT8850788.1 hypothetical protein [Lactobacillus delbrueckii subsp. bulgaricus]MBT8894845.1 hypothetical protein [Lactobacillus delbrueckii subsp. bulgaricus]MBT8896493.1 hypothetical protein [Lactobacillus delbrueckii subsp. bulgaricus]MBT8897781.1 hypothetical protein [Lactobacillus delbrueckii subsp. bulgaricus]